MIARNVTVDNHIPHGDMSDYHPLRNVIFIYYYTSSEIPIDLKVIFFTTAREGDSKKLPHAQNRCAYGSFYWKSFHCKWRNWTAILSRKSVNNSFICGWNNKVWVLIFLIGTSWTFWDQNWAVLTKIIILPKNRTIFISTIQFHVTFLALFSISRSNKCEFVLPTKYVSGKHLFLSGM